MSEFWGTCVIIGFFCIRLGVPLLMTALIVYLFHQLENKWTAEAGRS